MIRVLVADDHAVVRSGLGELLRAPDDIDFVGACADGESAITTAIAQRPDVVLMDLQMPGVDGIEATARLRALLPDVQVVVLTSFSDRERILAALEAASPGSAPPRAASRRSQRWLPVRSSTRTSAERTRHS
jgi:DNA-binding NarL/FixJ family response regulator